MKLLIFVMLFFASCATDKMPELLSDKKTTETGLKTARREFAQYDADAKAANRAGDSALYRKNLLLSVDADLKADSLAARLADLVYSIDSLQKLR